MKNYLTIGEEKIYVGASLRVFTHDDLDGAGCAVLSHIISNSVRVTNHSIAQLTHAVMAEIECNILLQYSLTLILDMHPTEELAVAIDHYNATNTSSKIIVIDHHEVKNKDNADYLRQYDWAKMYHSYNEVTHELVYGAGNHKVSATFVFYHLLKDTFDGKVAIRSSALLGFDDPNRCSGLIGKFVNMISRYDTWEWKKNPIGGDEIYLHYLLKLYGMKRFVDIFTERIHNCYPGARVLSNEELWYCENYNLGKSNKIPSYFDMIKTSYGLISCNGVYLNGDDSIREKKWAMLLMNFDNPCSEDYSSIMNEYLIRHPDVAFGIFPKIEENGSVVISVRSTDSSGINVNERCAQCGGGGHPRAAGTPIMSSDFADMINMYNETYESYEQWQDGMMKLIGSI